ncbi:hypothetical protein SCT_0277 [Sulfuricella sp. T08]|nr:hypothetical protein SCT_0277 [Sulfuricella sp. T08]
MMRLFQFQIEMPRVAPATVRPESVEGRFDKLTANGTQGRLASTMPLVLSEAEGSGRTDLLLLREAEI